ncbi:phage protease [Iodobacter sp.]|uniref:phage protease n=1 Tax=Iodobacter sp. TaxID=1915058 RepID=UPI0025D3DC00|nr:phage protease [Iodobacter sp.]
MTYPAPLFAALSVELTTEIKQAIKLLPAGEFRARDGRPEGCTAWVLDSENAALLVAAAARQQTLSVVDYEHQTLNAAENGKPAPAAGWFKELVWHDGDGLYAMVDWTDPAATMIAAKEYRYISPVFTYDKTGRVLGLLHVALTNTPALDELPPLSVAALSRLVSLTTQPQEPQMEELLEQLRWLLNLPVGATADDVKAQLQKLMTQLGGTDTAAASVDLSKLLAEQQTQIAALSAKPADPAKFVPIEIMHELQTKLAALSTQQQVNEVDELITVALSDGRLFPAQEEWARNFGTQDISALKGYLDKAPKLAALSTTQTKGKSSETIPHVSDGGNFITPVGCQVNQATLSLHKKALSYQAANPGMLYETAVLTMEKQQ